jgi:type IV conjugative transfer system protein TraE
MNMQTLNTHLNTIRSQRNSLLVLASGLLIINVFLSLTVFSKKSEVLVVPYLAKEFSVGASPSESYIRQMSDIHLHDLLNITPTNVAEKKARILKYTEETSWNDVNHYFNNLIEDYTKFNLTSFYTPKKIEIDTQQLTVLTSGILSLRYGLKGQEEKEKTYLLTYSFINGILLLKEFREVDLANS